MQEGVWEKEEEEEEEEKEEEEEEDRKVLRGNVGRNERGGRRRDWRGKCGEV